MALQIKHNTWRKENFNGGNKFAYTLYGTKEDIETEYARRQIGADDQYNIGATIEGSSMRRADGSSWYELEISSITRMDSAGNMTSGISAGPSEHSLAIRTMELPLETCATDYFHNTYRTKWNHILIAKKGNTTPSWWTTATDVIIPEADIEKYRWIKDVTDIPVGKGADAWIVLQKKLKPGVESFMFPSVEITERGFHKDANDAAWVIRNAGARATPKLGTFGIVTGEWLSLGGSVEKSGNLWVATCTYQWSPTTWDHDIYGAE